ncbi:MAG TPA: DUF4908 domain-containing protein [Polyangiaceae bacterium]
MAPRHWSARVALLAALVGACGGSGAPQPAAPEEREVTTGNEPTKFQRSRQVGHYSTLDGKSGVIVDRRSDTVKGRLDGSSEIKVLKSSGGPHGSTEYRSDDGSIWLRVDQYGDVVLFQGPAQKEGVEVVRDADAEPLD